MSVIMIHTRFSSFTLVPWLMLTPSPSTSGVPPSLVERVAASVSRGPVFVRELAEKIEEYFKKKERVEISVTQH